jgi:hypothetical protein
MKKGKKYLVVVYLAAGVSFVVPIRGRRNAQKCATRVVKIGLWTETEDGDEAFFPGSRIFKVRVVRGWKKLDG